MADLPCDCYQSCRCRKPATTIIIDAKGRARPSCEWHRTCPEFDYAKDEECFAVPFGDLSPELEKAWRKAEREWQRKLGERLRKLTGMLEASEARLAGVAERESARPQPRSEYQGELAL